MIDVQPHQHYARPFDAVVPFNSGRKRPRSQITQNYYFNVMPPVKTRALNNRDVQYISAARSAAELPVNSFCPAEGAMTTIPVIPAPPMYLSENTLCQILYPSIDQFRTIRRSNRLGMLWIRVEY